MTRSFVAALVLMTMVSGAHAAKPQDPLKIDALLHSLLQVQDRLAAGDEAALGLQSHLMKLLAAGIEESRSPAELSDAEIEALMIFGIIGTGSKAVSSVLFDRSMPQDFADLAQAIGTYRQRKRAQALKRFSKVDQDNVQERVRPFVAFALGNLLSRRWPKAAVRHYNLVRLDAPGTLLEEATIRRLMALYGSNNQPQPFLRLAMDYAQRFIESPYRKQYLKSLRKGIVAMRRGLTDDEIVSMALSTPGVHGARMTGGGFGGCVIVYTDTRHVRDVIQRVTRATSASHVLTHRW